MAPLATAIFIAFCVESLINRGRRGFSIDLFLKFVKVTYFEKCQATFNLPWSGTIFNRKHEPVTWKFNFLRCCSREIESSAHRFVYFRRLRTFCAVYVISSGVCQRQARITSCLSRNLLGLHESCIIASTSSDLLCTSDALDATTEFTLCSIWFGLHPTERHSIVFPAFANSQRFKMCSWLTIRRFFWLSMISSKSTMSWFRSKTCPRSWRFASLKRLSCSSFLMFWKCWFSC